MNHSDYVCIIQSQHEKYFLLLLKKDFCTNSELLR
jgi:hypothetical protein